jgi:hypothetical protein
MLLGMPSIGVRFDIDKVGGGYYGFACWKTFWRAIDPQALAGGLLHEGDTAATLAGQERVFCLAVQSSDAAVIVRVKRALAASQEFQAVCASPMFVEGQPCTRERLPEAGRIDTAGDLLGITDASRSALDAVREEREAAAAARPAEPLAAPRAKPASERTRDLPDLASFEGLRTFLGKHFTPDEYPLGRGVMYWVTPEELCDIVEEYAGLVAVEFREYPCDDSEDMCSVSLFEKHPPGARPIEFLGLYPFPSVEEAVRFGEEWSSVPKYAFVLPRLAGIRGRYHFNFRMGSEVSRSEPFPAGQGIPPGTLWNRISARLDRIGAELKREVEERERRRAEESEKRFGEKEERTRSESPPRARRSCIVCGLSLSFFDRLRGRDCHGFCQDAEVETGRVKR